jgi:nanoRNase/pAp phosphatase (c-di-AMP/oligoRNAs hydrolase)
LSGRDEGPPGGAVLLLVCDHPEVSRLRAGGRQVLRWVEDGEAEAGGADVLRGDPTAWRTFERLSGARSVTAVIALRREGLAQEVVEAVRRVRPDAAALVLAGGVESAPGDGTLIRPGVMRDVLRLDLEEELERIEAERRLWCLRRFAEGSGSIPVLVHPDPDPDALSSALCMRKLLGRSGEDLPIVTLRGMSRPENRRMAELLGLRVTEVREEDLLGHDRLIVVDSQPTFLRGRSEGPRVAVIDHHPAEEGYDAAYSDIRSDYGATATIMAEYLRSDGRLRVRAPLATALLYGIRTDTDGLRRGVSAADVEAYAHFQQFSDPQLLRRMEKPSYPPGAARAYGRAIESLVHENDLAVAWIRDIEGDALHVFADVADFCLGIEAVTWAVACGLLDGELVLTIRHTGKGSGAGALARALAAEGGSGGGHATMARVRFRKDSLPAWFADAGSEEEGATVAAYLHERLKELAERDRTREAESKHAPAGAGA